MKKQLILLIIIEFNIKSIYDASCQSCSYLINPNTDSEFF